MQDSARKHVSLIPVAIAMLWSGVAQGQSIPAYTELEENRDTLVKWLAEAPPGTEFYAESNPFDGGAETEIALIIDGVDIEHAGARLDGPDAWCQVMFLHLNVKSCTYGQSDSGQWMKMYMGRKYYQNPSKAKQIELVFDSGVTDDGVNWVTLTADEGPFNTSDYYVGLYAIEADGGTYAQLRSSQKSSSAISGAMDLYFATLASGKVGFSVVGTDRNGNPEYSGGTQAMLERNVVRYLLALRVYMQTHDLLDIEGAMHRAALWYDATEHYAEQLHEVDRDDYLEDKEKEYRHQVELQNAIN